MRQECQERFLCHRLQMKLPVSDPGMHHGTCVTHVPWCMSGSLTHGDGENAPSIPGACTTHNITYLSSSPWTLDTPYKISPWSSHHQAQPRLWSMTSFLQIIRPWMIPNNVNFDIKTVFSSVASHYKDKTVVGHLYNVYDETAPALQRLVMSGPQYKISLI